MDIRINEVKTVSNIEYIGKKLTLLTGDYQNGMAKKYF